MLSELLGSYHAEWVRSCEGMFAPDLAGAKSWRERNVSMVMIGTDQANLRAGSASALLETE
jgi:hypothetical protein